jgi:hypothetical protein
MLTLTSRDFAVFNGARLQYQVRLVAPGESERSEDRSGCGRVSGERGMDSRFITEIAFRSQSSTAPCDVVSGIN